jgi:hypothetical protein
MYRTTDPSPAKLHEVTGIILPGDWERRGGTPSLVIHGQDESETLVADTPKGRELLRHCRALVRASGRVREHQGRRELAVDAYVVLSPWRS